LKDILATVREELGLPNAAELTADLHSLLVYYLGQASGSEREYDIQELIDSEGTLTHWTGRAAPAWRRRRCR